MVILALELQVVYSLALLDKELKKGCYTALEVVPEMVMTESKIIDFLRTDDWIPSLAAVRLARFWKLRKTYL